MLLLLLLLLLSLRVWSVCLCVFALEETKEVFEAYQE
jgi:hypothetical protein